MDEMDSRAKAMFPLLENQQPLDFTSAPKTERPRRKDERECAVEPPVLDLSCKRIATPSPPPRSCPAERHLQVSNLGKIDAEHFSDTERKSPFTGRSYMVTPPSEGDSPKKTKYEPIYNQINSTTSEMSTSLYPVMPVPALSIPSVPGSPSSHPPLSTLVEPNHRLLQTQPSSIQIQASLADHHAIDSVTAPALSPDMGKKIPRPFKAYPKDPLSLTMGTPELICDQTSNEAYSEFRKRMLDSVKKTNEGTNIKMRRTAKSPSLPTSTMDEKDAAYWERRRKNNEAAKRSRDARRAKEDEIAIRAAFLEQENIKLKYELVALRNETAKLRCMVYSN